MIASWLRKYVTRECLKQYTHKPGSKFYLMLSLISILYYSHTYVCYVSETRMPQWQELIPCYVVIS